MPISFSTSSRTPAMNSRSCSTHRPHVSAATLQPSLLQTRCWKELAAGRLISAGLQRRKGGKLVHCYMNKTRVLNVRRQQCQCNLPQLLIQTARKSQARLVLAISHSATTLAASIATLVNILALLWTESMQFKVGLSEVLLPLDEATQFADILPTEVAKLVV